MTDTEKYNKTTFLQEISGYVKIALTSFGVAIIITTLLSFHARSEMIKNIYQTKKTDTKKIDEKIAKQISSDSELLESLNSKKYTICMQVGSLYESVGDYEKAQYAYELATTRVKRGAYLPYYKLMTVLTAQEKFDEAEKLINSITDLKDKQLIKFKTRSYIVMGDKYYSIGKFLKAAKSYEKANFYYDRFTKKDKIVDNEIKKRLLNSYIQTADVLVKNGYNSDAVHFLKKALKFAPDDYKIQYKLAVIYADLDPIKSVEYFEPLLEKMPQNIDYDTYNRVLMKAATIADLEGNGIKAKYYRYKIHSKDIFINQKVVYKDDIDVGLEDFKVKKRFFTYKLKGTYKFRNESSNDIYKLNADFVLNSGKKVKELVTLNCATKKAPLYSNGGETKDLEVKFGKNIFTKKELEQYVIDIYIYKDPKYKTHVASYLVPTKSVNFNKKEIDD